MNSLKRSFDEVSGYSPFQFPRNVRARINNRHQIVVVSTHRSHFRSILRDQRHATNDCKENVSQDSNCYSSDGPLSKASPQGRRIRFYQKVAVHSIPARHYYTDDIKQRIWCNMAELREMARRNTIEFAAEGYDWRRATEDDAMLLTPSGERIHPVWKQHCDFQPLQSKIRKIHTRTEA